MKIYKFLVYITVLFLLLFVNITSNAEVFHIPADKPTIQAGIDVAKDGDTVLVANGVYKGEGNVNIDFKGKNITVKSQNGPEATTVHCLSEPNTRGFIFQNGETNDAVLDGFTIRYGIHDNGGGIYCNNGSPTIKNCVIEWNRTVKTDNVNGRGGGIYCFNSDAKIIDSIISHNSAESAYGGGVYFDGDSIIDGVFVRETVSEPSLLRCTISDNTGSGVHVHSFVLPQLKNSKILHNSWGGIVCAFFNTNGTNITHCEIAQNTGAGVSAREYSILNITDSIIKQNIAKEGGGINCGPTASIYVSECVITENIATKFGGGINIDSTRGEAKISYCTITQNTASEKGGGIYVWSQTSFSLTNSIVWGNNTEVSHDDAFIQQDLFANITVINCCIKNRIQDIALIFQWDIANIQGNIHEDPLFVDAEGGDYRLKPDSPALAMGAYSTFDEIVSVTSVGKKVVLWAELKQN